MLHKLFSKKTNLSNFTIPATACLAAFMVQAPAFAQTDQADQSDDFDEMVLRPWSNLSWEQRRASWATLASSVRSSWSLAMD